MPAVFRLVNLKKGNIRLVKKNGWLVTSLMVMTSLFGHSSLLSLTTSRFCIGGIPMSQYRAVVWLPGLAPLYHDPAL